MVYRREPGCAATACSEESGGTASDTTTTEETTTTESSEPADDAPATGESGNIEYTAPGTELKIGDKAVVPYMSGGERGAIGITVTAVEKGAPADIGTAGAGFDSCRIAPSTGTVAVTGAEYDDGSDVAPGTDYSEAPITWQ